MLPMAIMILFVIVLLTVAVVQAAVQSNTFSNQQTYADQAFATAEVGLQTAYHRLSSAVEGGESLVAGDCFTTKDTGSGPTAKGCPAVSESVGANSYTYYVEPLVSAPKNCVGLKVLGGAVVQRCITATATVHGVTRRVQERVAGGASSLPSSLSSLSTILLKNTTSLVGNLTANGEVTPGPATVTGTITGSKINSGFKCSGCTEVVKAETLGSKYPEVNPEPYEISANPVNNQANIQGLANYNSATRDFSSAGTMGTEASPYQLQEGTYNFCNVSFTQTVWLEIPKETAGHPTKVTWYIDSPERPGLYKCASAGKVKATNGMCIINASENPANFKIYDWGDNPNHSKLSEFNFTNGLCSGHALIAELYAPYTLFQATNGGSISGSFLAGEVLATNGLKLGAAGGWLVSSATAAAAWGTCTKSPSGEDPSTGCY